MPLDLDTLPTDPADLRRLVLALAEERDVEKDRADRLEHLLVQLKRLMFGRRSEKLDPDQLALAFEDLEQSIAAVHAEMDAAAPVERRRRRTGDERASLPKTLPEIERVIDVAPEDKVCPCCKGERHVIGEDCQRRLNFPRMWRAKFPHIENPVISRRGDRAPCSLVGGRSVLAARCAATFAAEPGCSRGSGRRADGGDNWRRRSG